MARVLALLGAIAMSGISCADEVEVPSHPEGSRDRRRYGTARVLGRLEHPDLVEASGLVASTMTESVFWVHNDSGDVPRLFCVERNGRSCGTVSISGAKAIDWEDIASHDGKLYIGDIGDNAGSRTSVDVYVVAEREPPGRGETATWDVERRHVLSYPTGPFDAETLLVHPRTGALFVVTKGSPAVVLRGDASGRMSLVGALRLPGLVGLPTGGDINADGAHVIVTTYDRAFELSLDRGRAFDSIWRARPREVALPLAPQREAIAYTADGGAIVSTSEGRRAQLVERALVPD